MADATTQPPHRLVLASASPRRSDLLHTLGLSFDVIATDIDERLLPRESPYEYVTRLSRAKAFAVDRPDTVVIAADTCVVRDTTILGKPSGAKDAVAMLQSLSGRDHVVLTGVTVRINERSATGVDATTVTFRMLDASTIDWYVSTGEPFDKAGGYGMQSYGGLFVQRIDGSPSNVVGLPLHLVDQLAHAATIDLSEFRVDPATRSPDEQA